ncbi:arylamine N-acetyltransferase [Methylopila henanensis]|uniref:Arylamine N-acetyltransferase n=1 Tax=Methylopila henanensis TaxID=873516 RepID=A0ABW4K2C4_9HYPH
MSALFLTPPAPSAELLSPDEVDLDAYFTRIGYRGPLTPSHETLAALQRAHLAAIPFEAIDVALGRVVDIAPVAIDRKLIAARRGGFCYEQNGLFQRVLSALGFEVRGLLARVLLGRADDELAGRTHRTLRVTVEGQPYLVDVGFGAMVPPEPLRLDDPRPQETAHEPWRITSSRGITRVLAMTEDGWSPMYEFSDEAHTTADYVIANWFTCTHPSSFFRRFLVAARIAPEARFALMDRRLTIRRPGAAPERHMLGAGDLERVLSDTFKLMVEPNWRPLLERAAKT